MIRAFSSGSNCKAELFAAKTSAVHRSCIVHPKNGCTVSLQIAVYVAHRRLSHDAARGDIYNLSV